MIATTRENTIATAKRNVAALPKEVGAPLGELVDRLDGLMRALGELRWVLEDETVSAGLIEQYRAFDEEASRRESAGRS